MTKGRALEAVQSHLSSGLPLVVPPGHLPEREIVTGMVQSSCAVRRCVIVLAETRSASALRRRFPYARRSKKPRSVGPDPLAQGRLHRRLRGGADRTAQQGRAGGLSATTVGRLKEGLVAGACRAGPKRPATQRTEPELAPIVEATIPGCRMVVRSPLTGTQAGSHRTRAAFLKNNAVGRRRPTFR